VDAFTAHSLRSGLRRLAAKALLRYPCALQSIESNECVAKT
jgi:hypothetical protein